MWRIFLPALCIAGCAAASRPRHDLGQTVSGVCSGGYMALQRAVAPSESIRVAVTAAGPYFGVGEAAGQGTGIAHAMRHGMQGDPLRGPGEPITAAERAGLGKQVARWAAGGKEIAASDVSRATPRGRPPACDPR